MTRVLIVEDSRTQAAILEMALLDHGWDPACVVDAEAALIALAASPYDAVISDIVMPGMSGYDLCRNIKADARWKDIPVILLTSLTNPLDVMYGLEAGADNFFTKPYEPGQLIKRLSAIFENRKLAADGKLRLGYEVVFLGRRFSVTSERQQILDLLLSTFEQTIDTNQKLERSKQEIALARDQAEAATLAKANFLAAMSHEIRTPMNGIVGMVDLLNEGDLNDDQRKMISTIKSSAYSLVGIIGDILDFSKLEAGRMRLEAAPVHIDEMLESVGIAFWRGLTEKSLVMPMFCDPRIPIRVLGDPVRIRQILSNLIGNAVKFTRTTPGQRGKIVVRADLVEKNANRVKVRFSIADNGIGMSDEVKSRLFRPFEQADASTVRQYGGTGLGLSICKQLVGLMDGRIGVESTLGVGTTFWTELWFDGQGDGRNRVDLGGIRVLNLLQDDRSEIAEYLVHYIKHLNGEAEIVVSADQCIARIRDVANTPKKFDVVVISSHFSAAEQTAIRDRIEAIPELRNIRFILMNADYQRAPHMTSPSTMTITAAPLCYSTYVSSVAIAAGRASPATQMLVEDERLPTVKAPSIEDARAAGQLILVAEDNEVNRDVLKRQLARLGYAAVMVGDGKQALEAYRTDQFCLLLTDCHMPEMDGYQLTTAIRADERTTHRHIPIIALTANALHGESERCLEIGMDDFVVKPVELRAFRSTLKRWVPAASSSPANGDTHHETPTAVKGRTVFDVSVLERLVDGDPEAVQGILKGFEASARRGLTTVRTACESHVADQIIFGAHMMRSPANTVGAMVLADICVALEKAAPNEDWPRIETLVAELDSTLETLVAHINAKLRSFEQVA